MEHSGLSVLFEGVNLQRILLGFLVSTRLALVSVSLSVVFGVMVGIVMTSRNALVALVCRFYLEAMRIIPVLVWLFIVYFGLSRLLGINLSGETASILVFTLWGAAEMGDIVRGAVTSLSRHQIESAQALGLGRMQVYRYVVVPQAVRRLAPPAVNLATRMVKTTSLVLMIGVVEVQKVGQQVIEMNYLTKPSAAFWVYGLVLLLYFALCAPFSHLAKRLEKAWEA